MINTAQPGRVYTPDDFRRGICPSRGARSSYFDASTGAKEFILCEVAAAQNLISGHVVSITAGFVASAVTNTTNVPTLVSQCGVDIASVTASASTFIWVQIMGRCTVMCSTSALPNIAMKPGSVTGSVDDDLVSTSAFVQGLYLTATSGVSPTLCNAVLIYPHFARDTIA